jgi:hypothetical protein
MIRQAQASVRMHAEIEKWFSDPKHDPDTQDMDLVLADVEFLPRLKAYLDDPSASLDKLPTVISALLEILEHDCPRDGGSDTVRVAEEIKTAIRQHADVAQRAISDLGPVKRVVLLSILGLEIPADYPKWVIDRANEEGA